MRTFLPALLLLSACSEYGITDGGESPAGDDTAPADSGDGGEPATEPCEADEAPTLRITSPAQGATLEAGPVVLEAAVSDDADPPESLALRWASDVDGVIGTAPAAADGSATVEWGAGRTQGDHRLSLTATDSCGNVAETDLTVCQQAGYTSDELAIDTWHFEGSATWDTTNDWLQLTDTGGYLVGTAFQTSAAVSGDAVSIRFSFYIGGGSGADGISLTAIDTSRMSTYLGGSGCGIGYGGDASCTDGPALPGWSVEVDTWFNDGQDPTAEDHVMFTFDGDVDDPAAWAALPEMEDNGWHEMEVVVAAPHLTVSIDGVSYLDTDLGGNLSFPAYIGFTAGTGGSTNYHLIDSLEVTEYVCPE